ncbi:uncharacterized protein LOC144132498 isoform X1 [Amblyomma americanum]
MPITAVPSVYHVQRRYSICPATFMGMETGTASITHSVDRDRPLPRVHHQKFRSECLTHQKHAAITASKRVLKEQGLWLAESVNFRHALRDLTLLDVLDIAVSSNHWESHYAAARSVSFFFLVFFCAVPKAVFILGTMHIYHQKF